MPDMIDGLARLSPGFYLWEGTIEDGSEDDGNAFNMAGQVRPARVLDLAAVGLPLKTGGEDGGREA